MGVFVEEETRRQNELMSPANKPLLSPEHPQPSSFFLEKTKLSTTLLPPMYLVPLPAYSRDDGYVTGRAGDVMGLLRS